MNNWNILCPGCFEEKGNVATCPQCDYNESGRRSPLALRHRTLLEKKYLVGRILGKPGGFGITYLGWDTTLYTRVAIKEFLPRDLAGRDTDRTTVIPHTEEDEKLFLFGLEQFIQEARTLAKFDHANVVRVRSFFEENSTAYLVMDYYEGVSLADYLKQKGGRIPEKTAIDIMIPILDGLREVHTKGYLHRDIKPNNIYLTNDGRPILLDFGATRFALGERSRSLSVVLTPGFAPYEQYHRRGQQGPWTDIYACAATLYNMITGVTPPEAIDRKETDELKLPQQIVADISPHINKLLMKALAIEINERPQTIKAFQTGLMAKLVSPSVKPIPSLEPKPVSSPQKTEPPLVKVPIDLERDKVIKEKQKKIKRDTSKEQPKPGKISTINSMFLCALGGLIAGIITWNIRYSLGWAFNRLIYYAIGGVITVLIIRKIIPDLKRKNMLLIVIGWVIVGFFARPMYQPEIFFLNTFLFGGLITALCIKNAISGFKGKQLFIITVGYMLGGMLLRIIFYPLIHEILYYERHLLLYIIDWIIPWAIGVGTISWQVKRLLKSESNL